MTPVTPADIRPGDVVAAKRGLKSSAICGSPARHNTACGRRRAPW